MAVCWLCAVQHHENRVFNEAGKRLRCYFPQTPWFVELVAQHELQEWTRRSNNSPKFFLLGFVKCEEGIAAEDLLSQYSHRKELDMWRSFWTGMGNVYTILITDRFVFQEPQPVYTCQDLRYEQTRPLTGRKNPLAPFQPPSARIAETVGTFFNHSEGREGRVCTAADAARSWGIDLDEILLAVPVVDR